MSAAASSFARSSARPRRFIFDPVLLLTVALILLLGLVMMTSASISIADRQLHKPLYFLERQLGGVLLGLIAAALAMAIPTSVWEHLALPLLALAFVLLIIVLIPGVAMGSAGSSARIWWQWSATKETEMKEPLRVRLSMTVYDCTGEIVSQTEQTYGKCDQDNVFMIESAVTEALLGLGKAGLEARRSLKP